MKKLEHSYATILMSSKKLIYIGNRLEPQGGTPTSIDFLAPLLEQAGHEVKTASAKSNKMLRLADMLLLILKNSGTSQVVLIDTYSTSNFWYAYFSAMVCKKLGMNYIPLLHGGDLPARLERSPRACRTLFNNAALNISPSVFIKEKFLENGISRVQYIPNSLILERYSFKRRTTFSPKLLWVRAFSEIYDPLLAIKTLEILLKKFPQAELCMVGPEKDASFNICQTYVEENHLPVKFTGMLEKQEWHALAAEYDIFLNTTKIDNTPVSVIEAMALGLPVVSTRVGGIPYLIDNGVDGVLISSDSPIDMAGAVEDLLSNKEKAMSLAAAARLKVEKFDWSLVKNKWNELLSNIS